MIIKCLENTGKHLSKKYIDDGIFKQSQYNELIIGEKYKVGGISYSDELKYYLVLIENWTPIIGSWCPAELFEIVDNKIPTNWYFNILDKEVSERIGRTEIFGYYELTFDVEHYIKIFDWDKNALEILYKRMQEA